MTVTAKATIVRATPTSARAVLPEALPWVISKIRAGTKNTAATIKTPRPYTRKTTKSSKPRPR